MNGRALPVGGLVRFSTLDYPGQLAAVVFCQGCPWRCGYCHNPGLQPSCAASMLAWDDVIAFLAQRRGLLDAVVFSGGEPTLHAGLEAAMREVRALGFKVGLHSAGIYPLHLAPLWPLLDWIGLDLKAPFDAYARITGVSGSGDKALAAAQLVLDSGVDYEFRTTLHAALLSAGDIEKLALQLDALGVRRYALQTFRAAGCVNEALLRTASQTPELPVLAETLTRMFEHFELRAV
jgi:pyruvate formate lyase activating enzyme